MSRVGLKGLNFYLKVRSHVENALRVQSSDVTGEAIDKRPESDARSFAPLRIHPPPTRHDGIGIRPIDDIEHRISYSTAEHPFDSPLVDRYFRKTFSPCRLSGL
jgi:hypothetical protein